MLGPDPAPRHAGWEEMLKRIRLRVAGGVPDVPPVVTTTHRGPKTSRGQGQSRVSSGSGSSPQPKSGGEMPPRRIPRGGLGLPVPLPSQAMAVSPGTLLHGRRAPACAANPSIPKTHPWQGGAAARFGVSIHPPAPAPGVPASVVPGEGVSGGGNAPAAPTALRRAPFIRWVSKRSASPRAGKKQPVPCGIGVKARRGGPPTPKGAGSCH